MTIRMIRSMTGYGRGEGRYQSCMMVVELRSVNHRYCEVMLRLAKPLLAIETDFKKLIQDRFTRGRIDCSVTLDGGEESAKHLSLNRELARQYYSLLEMLKQDLGLEGKVDLAMLANFRDLIVVTEPPVLLEELGIVAKRLLKKAIESLDEMRQEEGRQLYQDLTNRIEVLRQSLKKIHSRVPRVVKSYRGQLMRRVKMLTRGIKLDHDRIHQEVALYAERCDVTEEVTRLQSHIKQFEKMVSGNQAVGRSLDFLIQEMNREVNTIGSKSNDVRIAREVVHLKGELEKLREQVQNVE
jgi:uncharacterized protein (TIGR00255 family)